MKTYHKAAIVAIFLAGASWLCAQTRNIAPASRPVTATPAKYPDDKLIADAKRQAAALKARLDGSFNVIVEPPFVIAGNMPAAALKGYARGTVINPAEAMWKCYFAHKPDKVITVLLFTDDGVRPPRDDGEVGYAYRSWARKLFGDTDVSYYGYYKPDAETMVMNIDTGGGTLVHELTHALIVYDFPDVPDWFNEGLGSLHEQCNVESDRVVGLENWRLPDLQKAIRAGKLRPLRDLLTQDNFRDARTMGMNYAQARYFCMYMQERGVLKEFYRYLRDHADAADASVVAAEHVFKDKLPNIEKRYLAWVLPLHFPPRG